MPKPSRAFVAIALLVLATLAAIAPRFDAAAFDYIRNGSFEYGSDGWRSGNLELTIAGADEVPPVNGISSGRITLVGGPFTVSQTIFDVPPGAYAFSASVRRTLPETQIVLRAQITGDDGNSREVFAPTGTANEWIRLSGEISLLTFSQLRIAIGGTGSGIVYIDDVRLEGAPPITATQTPAATETAAPSATATPTGTRTAAPTKTPSPTKTPVPTRTPAATPSATAALSASLSNAGFEEAADGGGPAYWTSYGGDLSLTAALVRTGNRAARFESKSASTKWIFQPVRVDPGAAYAFEAWIADSDAAVGAASLRISWYGSDDASGRALSSSDSLTQVDAPAAGFRQLTTGAVTAPGAARSARLRILLAPVSAASATIVVDDASFGPAELAGVAPTSAPTSAAGGGAADGAIAAPLQGVLGATRRPPQGTPRRDGTTGAANHVVINEVLYDPDTKTADAAGEWVELYNTGEQPAQLSGWSIGDAASADTLGDLTIEPHGFAIVAASDSFRAAYPSYGGPLVTAGGRIGNSLGNDGDRLVLADATGAVVDAVSWGSDTSAFKPSVPDVPAGHSIERRSAGVDTDAAADFVDNAAPSPGRAIDAAVSDTSGRKPNIAASQAVEVLAPSGGGPRGWLPWALAAAAIAALAGALGWRIAPVIISRWRTRT